MWYSRGESYFGAIANCVRDAAQSAIKLRNPPGLFPEQLSKAINFVISAATTSARCESDIRVLSVRRRSSRLLKRKQSERIVWVCAWDLPLQLSFRPVSQPRQLFGGEWERSTLSADGPFSTSCCEPSRWLAPNSLLAIAVYEISSGSGLEAIARSGVPSIAVPATAGSWANASTQPSSRQCRKMSSFS